jgi:hypothetical protein
MALNEEISLHFLDVEAPFFMKGGLPQEGACSPVVTYRIVWIGESHGRSLNRGLNQNDDAVERYHNILSWVVQ